MANVPFLPWAGPSGPSHGSNRSAPGPGPHQPHHFPGVPGPDHLQRAPNYQQFPAEQLQRILQMHKDSKQHAVIYVMVVLVLYFMALAILIGRYLQQERDHATLLSIARFLRRCLARCRGQSKSDAANAIPPSAGAPSASNGAITPPSPKTRLRSDLKVTINVTINVPEAPDHDPPPRRKASQAPLSETSSDSDSWAVSSKSSSRNDLDRLQVPRLDLLAVCAKDDGDTPSVVSVMVCDVIKDTAV